MDPNKKIIIIVSSIILTLVLIFVLSGVFSGIKSLDTNQVGLKYSSWSKTIDKTKLYEKGTHFLGFYSKFVKFQIDLTSINDTINVRSKEGMLLNIQISYQYVYVKEITKLLQLINNFGMDGIELGLLRIERDIIRTSCAELEVEQFVFDRNQINAKLSEDLTLYLKDFGMNVQNFQLLNIDYPGSYSSAITNSNNEKLKINQAQNELTNIVEQLAGIINKAEAEGQVIYNSYIQKAYNETEKIYKNIEVMKNYVKNINPVIVDLKNILGEDKIAEYLIVEFMKGIKHMSFYPYTPSLIKQLYTAK